MNKMFLKDYQVFVHIGRLRYCVLLHGMLSLQSLVFNLEIGKLRNTIHDSSGH